MEALGQRSHKGLHVFDAAGDVGGVEVDVEWAQVLQGQLLFPRHLLAGQAIGGQDRDEHRMLLAHQLGHCLHRHRLPRLFPAVNLVVAIHQTAPLVGNSPFKALAVLT